MSEESTIKILVADDEIDLEDIVRFCFRKQIQEHKFDFVFAHNGLEALSKLIEFPEIGIILCDINMPEMDGLTLLSELKELKNPSLKTVMVSAYGDMENIRTAMNRGAYDFITKPINFEDLEKTIEKTLDEIRQIRFLQEEKKKRGIEDDDKEVSREIQRAILPKAAPEYRLNKTFTIEGLLIPSNDTACSFYDYFKVDPTNLGFVIGDVCSHCLSSAIFMAITRTLIRATGEKGLPSAKCLNYVNSLLCHEGTSQMYSSICYGVLNIETGELDYATAGQYSPIIYLNDGNSITLPATDLQRLGIDKHHKFNSNLVKIEPGSMIFLYTQNLLKSNEQDLNSQIGEHGFALAKTLATKKLSPDYKKEIERTLLAPGEKKPNVDIAMLSVCI